MGVVGSMALNGRYSDEMPPEGCWDIKVLDIRRDPVGRRSFYIETAEPVYEVDPRTARLGWKAIIPEEKISYENGIKQFERGKCYEIDVKRFRRKDGKEDYKIIVKGVEECV